MKHSLLFVAVFILSTFVTAQNSISLDLDFLYEGQPFNVESQYVQDNGNPIVIDRCEFYISQISIEHDNGQITPITDTWILADPNQLSYDLGVHTISEVEAVHFSIGVEQPVNNDDPSLWPAEHPLAPQNPSMHWGWTSGYRFIAIEGQAGDSPLSQIWEIHALGNNQYYSQTVYTGGVVTENAINIRLNVNVEEFLEGLNPDGGFIAHGETGPRISRCIENARDHVFTATDGTVNIDQQELPKLKMYPNPAKHIVFMENIPDQQVTVYGANGVISEARLKNGKIDLSALSGGLYIIQVLDENGMVLKDQLIIE